MIQIYYHLKNDGMCPLREKPSDAGILLKSPIDIQVRPNEIVSIDTGVHLEIQSSSIGLLKSCSRTHKYLNIVGDDYLDVGSTDSVQVELINFSPETIDIHRGDFIAQVILTYVETPSLREVRNLGFFKEVALRARQRNH